MALVFTHRHVLYIVLDDENLDRVARFDPFDLDQTTVALAVVLPLTVCVCYAHRDEYEQLQRLDPDALVAHLRRGYQERASDHERAVRFAPRKPQ